jgi:hypothetical protein
VSIPEIPPVVGELWPLKEIVFATTVSLARQQLAHNSYVSSNWHFKWVYCFHLESADKSTVTLRKVQNYSSTTLHHTEEDLILQKHSLWEPQICVNRLLWIMFLCVHIAHCKQQCKYWYFYIG